MGDDGGSDQGVNNLCYFLLLRLCLMALIRRKHQTNPNWGAFYKVLNLPCSKESRSKKKNQGHGRKGMTRRLSQPERDCRDPVTKCNSWWLWMGPFDLKQQPPTFLVIGMGFMEDNFSMDKGEGMVSGWFSQGARNLDPSHVRFRAGFTLPWESNAWMGENNSKWNNWQTTNLKNIQATSAAQFHKNKRPNQKMGQRTK